MSIRFLTAGDSHGEVLAGIIEGLPAGVRVALKDVHQDMARRRMPLGRSSRQAVEQDAVSIVSGLWKGRTTGAPLALLIPNRGLTVGGKKGGAMGTVPRPGHADLAGCLKYGLDEIPPVSERASARSTAMRVAIGAVAKIFLARFSIDAIGHVVSIGSVAASLSGVPPGIIKRRAARSPVYCADAAASKRMIEEIEAAGAEGNSLGGSVEIVVTGVVPGLGSHVEWDRRLDSRLAGAMMSIQSVKAVEIGDGIAGAGKRGADAHDAMAAVKGAVVRSTNFAGGIEGGMTNGEDVVVRLYAKPIPTTRRRSRTFDLKTLESQDSPYVRSDVCVIPSLAVIAESVAAWEMLCVLLEKFGGDNIDDTLSAHARYTKTLRERLRR
jgi:chorismate synthase